MVAVQHGLLTNGLVPYGGEGVGLHGQTYAIPTMQGGVDTIKPYVDAFIRFAKEHPERMFLVTRIGCGIAGFRDEEIAPLFTDAIEVENIILPMEFVENISPEGKRNYYLERFLTAHKYNYENALREITDGRKRTHWIWFIFPQLAVLGHSANAKYYGISGYDEAKAYYEHPHTGRKAEGDYHGTATTPWRVSYRYTWRYRCRKSSLLYDTLRCCLTR